MHGQYCLATPCFLLADSTIMVSIAPKLSIKGGEPGDEASLACAAPSPTGKGPCARLGQGYTSPCTMHERFQKS